MTNENLADLRRKEVRDSLALRRMWIGVAIVLVVVPLLILLDVGFTPIVGVDAVVEAKVNQWSLKYGHRCMTYLETPLGKTSISDFGGCVKRPLSVGDRVKIAARIGRITGSIKVMRDYGMLALPHMDTAGGLDIFPRRDYINHPPDPAKKVR